MVESKTKVVVGEKPPAEMSLRSIAPGEGFAIGNALYIKASELINGEIHALSVNGKSLVWARFFEPDKMVRHIPVTITFHE